MKTLLIIYFVVVAIVLVLGFIFVQFALPKSYNNVHSTPFSRKQMFPAELLVEHERYAQIAKILVILLGALMFIGAGFLLACISILPSLSVSSVFILIAGGFSSIAFAGLFLIKPLDNIRFHVFDFVFFGALSALFDFGNIIAFITIPMNTALPYIFVAVMGLLCLGKIALLLNPKLMNWAKLDSKMEQDGTVTYSRPNPFLIALTEWIFVYAHLASAFLAILFSLLLIVPFLG